MMQRKELIGRLRSATAMGLATAAEPANVDDHRDLMAEAASCIEDLEAQVGKKPGESSIAALLRNSKWMRRQVEVLHSSSGHVTENDHRDADWLLKLLQIDSQLMLGDLQLPVLVRATLARQEKEEKEYSDEAVRYAAQKAKEMHELVDQLNASRRQLDGLRARLGQVMNLPIETDDKPDVDEHIVGRLRIMLRTPTEKRERDTRRGELESRLESLRDGARRIEEELRVVALIDDGEAPAS